MDTLQHAFFGPRPRFLVYTEVPFALNRSYRYYLCMPSTCGKGKGQPTSHKLYALYPTLYTPIPPLCVILGSQQALAYVSSLSDDYAAPTSAEQGPAVLQAGGHKSSLTGVINRHKKWGTCEVSGYLSDEEVIELFQSKYKLPDGFQIEINTTGITFPCGLAAPAPPGYIPPPIAAARADLQPEAASGVASDARQGGRPYHASQAAGSASQQAGGPASQAADPAGRVNSSSTEAGVSASQAADPASGVNGSASQAAGSMAVAQQVAVAPESGQTEHHGVTQHINALQSQQVSTAPEPVADSADTAAQSGAPIATAVPALAALPTPTVKKGISASRALGLVAAQSVSAPESGAGPSKRQRVSGSVYQDAIVPTPLGPSTPAAMQARMIRSARMVPGVARSPTPPPPDAPQALPTDHSDHTPRRTMGVNTLQASVHEPGASPMQVHGAASSAEPAAATQPAPQPATQAHEQRGMAPQANLAEQHAMVQAGVDSQAGAGPQNEAGLRAELVQMQAAAHAQAEREAVLRAEVAALKRQLCTQERELESVRGELRSVREEAVSVRAELESVRGDLGAVREELAMYASYACVRVRDDTQA